MSELQRPFWVLSAPSGTGKNAVLERLITEYPAVGKVTTATTRAPRAGERPGIDYHFLSEDEFSRGIAAGDFLEWKPVFGHRYGVPKWALEGCRAEVPIIILDVLGALDVRARFATCRTVFLEPPSLEVLTARLQGRGTDSPDEQDRRIARASEEMACAHLFDYCVVNDDLERAVRELARLMGVA